MRLTFFVVFTYLAMGIGIGYSALPSESKKQIKTILSMPLTQEVQVETQFSRCNPYSIVPCNVDRANKLVNKLAVGFATALSKETSRWHICGELVAQEDWVSELSEIAKSMLNALDEQGLTINPWGPWGVIYKESRGNRCAIGPNPRKAAYKYNLIEEKSWYLWSEDEIVDVVTHRRWGRRLADLGLGQVVWRKEARLVENGIERIPTAREMLSLEYGMKVLAHGMERRTRYKYNRRWHHMPWLFWPGTRPHPRYGHDIERIVQKMGGPHQLLR